MSRVAIPPESIGAETLRRLLREFVTRDGTDYGLRETPESERVEQLADALERGDAVLLFDVDAQTHDIVTRESARFWLGEEGV